MKIDFLKRHFFSKILVYCHKLHHLQRSEGVLGSWFDVRGFRTHPMVKH